MSADKKPREWTIQLLGDKVMGARDGLLMNAENVHVIEHSAYEAAISGIKILESDRHVLSDQVKELRAEIARLEAELEQAKCQHCGYPFKGHEASCLRAYQDLKELRTHADKLAAAIEEWPGMFEGTKHAKALAEYKEMKNGRK
jgi:uncharacterized small protein (DUF1192 family)